MPIIATDLQLKLSIKTGAAGNAAAQADPNQSLGKYVSTTTLAAGANTLFDNISGAENSASTVDYRCLFVLNNHATLTLLSAVVYLSAEVASGASIAIAVDSVAATAKASASAQAALIATEGVAPTPVGAFSSPTTRAAGIALGDIGPGAVRAIWVRRSAANTAAVNADGVTFAIAGDSAA